MSGPELPGVVPVPLKNIQGYLKIANEHDQRDPVISYWCRLYSLQTGLKLSTKTNEETGFLVKLMDWLEQRKKDLQDNEAITNEVAAQAHIDNLAHRLFVYADQQDRASNFGRATIQSFFSAGLLYDVLTLFGEPSDEVQQNRKYAKWKAAYIHNCLKNGETPVPGPASEEDEEEITPPKPSTPQVPPRLPSQDQHSIGNNGQSSNFTPFDFPPVAQPTQPKPQSQPQPTPQPRTNPTPMVPTGSGTDVNPEHMGRAQKLIKWASSALNYDDVSTAVTNLQKALNLLTTGSEE